MSLKIIERYVPQVNGKYPRTNEGINPCTSPYV